MPDYTVKFPLEINNLNLGFETINESNIKDLAIFNLKNIILTNPGERVFEPLFGVGIKKYIFEQTTPFIQDEIISSIKSQTNKYAPYIEIINISITNEDNSMNIVIKYEVTTVGIIDELALTISP